MKRLIPTIASVFLLLCFVSCSQDSDYTTESTLEAAHLLHDQLPQRAFNQSTEGLYHGAVQSASTTARGKIWVNIANDGMFNALIEMTSGESYVFEAKAELISLNGESPVIEFVGDAGSFSIDLGNIQNPVIEDLTLNGEAFFTHLVKSMSSNPASVATAVFIEFSDPMFNGTWSIIADGSIVNPNGDNGDGITSVMIVYNGVSYTDTNMDLINAASCLGNGSYVPTINSFGVTGSVVSDYQTTAFADGMAKWDLGYDAATDTYMDYRNCNAVVSGMFYWTNSESTITKTGEILMD